MDEDYLAEGIVVKLEDSGDSTIRSAHRNEEIARFTAYSRFVSELCAGDSKSHQSTSGRRYC